jgi:uncharacterized protein (TIGR02117 family)
VRIARRVAAWTAGSLLGLALVFVAVVVVTSRPGDPDLFPVPVDAPGIDILLIHNGYHSGLVLPRASISSLASEQEWGALAVVARRFAAYEWVEVGWGEARFYREVPTIDRLNLRLALSALFEPNNEAVLHIVGIWDEPQKVFHGAEQVPLRISQEGAARLFARLNDTFDLDSLRMPEELGPGLYGPSLFFRAKGHFNILHVCNHWIADLLHAAGVPTSPVLATLPRGLVLDLVWRSHLKSQPAT